MLPAPFVVKAHWSSSVITTQQGAIWKSGIAPLMVRRLPSGTQVSDDMVLEAASLRTKMSVEVNAKPYGPSPTEGIVLGALAMPVAETS
jgi:hypothetical protein